MKVTLDLNKLLAENKITQQEYDKFKQLGSESTGSLAFNILIGFGVLAVSLAALALVPTAMTAAVIGLLLYVGGIGLRRIGPAQWLVLSQILILIGALLLGGSIIALFDGQTAAFLMIAAIFAVGAVLAESGLLSALAVLALGPTVGSQTAYMHASYFLMIKEPLLTIILFSILGSILFLLSQKLAPVYERLAVIGARTSLFMVNLGFWIGSLWGDKYNHHVDFSETSFSILWAIGLIGVAIWAWYNNLRWVLNLTAVFGAIHFYTQWFEHLGATPSTVLLAGVIALALALGLRFLNLKMRQSPSQG